MQTVIAPKSLKTILKKHSGRSGGRVTVRGQGGRQKRYYREVDFKRNKLGVQGEIISFEYDPNRNVQLALVKYEDGEYKYILAPKDLKMGSFVVSNDRTEVKVGNALRLKNMPVGTFVHNVELTPGRGGQIGRSAGVGLQLLAKESGYAHLKMPSGEIRKVSMESFATVGMVGNEEVKDRVLGKAGRARHMGRRPTVRGTAMDPESHAHGGGEGRSGVGRKKPMTVYGKPAVGKTRKRKKWTSKYILQRRTK
ncbi:50S ribosomal protein L2 [Candidatus Daviesbacteria bacterium]|nr:50S ribosomal protein L2 [Candidatus Daviesbacteria bacterium]